MRSSLVAVAMVVSFPLIASVSRAQPVAPETPDEATAPKPDKPESDKPKSDEASGSPSAVAGDDESASSPAPLPAPDAPTPPDDHDDAMAREATQPSTSPRAARAPEAAEAHGSGAALARYQPPPAEAVDRGPSRDMSRDFWQVSGSLRTTWVPSEGYDPFDENDGFHQWSLGATRALLLNARFSFAPGLLWEAGTVTSEARGAESKLAVYRLGAIAEGRFHVGRDLYLSAKLVPQAVHTRAHLQDASSPAELRQIAWRFGMDATAGAAWNIPRSMGGPNQLPQFWLLGELGYGWTMSNDLVLQPDLPEDDPRAEMKLDLGPLALSGIMMRVGVAVTF